MSGKNLGLKLKNQIYLDPNLLVSSCGGADPELINYVNKTMEEYLGNPYGRNLNPQSIIDCAIEAELWCDQVGMNESERIGTHMFDASKRRDIGTPYTRYYTVTSAYMVRKKKGWYLSALGVYYLSPDMPFLRRYWLSSNQLKHIESKRNNVMAYVNYEENDKEYKLARFNYLARLNYLLTFSKGIENIVIKPSEKDGISYKAFAPKYYS